MAIHLKAKNIIDPETEAHYSFKTIQPLQDSHGRIITTTYHDHDFYELFLITHGRIWHLINDTEILLSAGALVFIRPSDCHSYRQYEGDDCGLINLAFPAQTIEAFFAYLGDGFQPERLINSELPPSVQLHETERQAAINQLTKLNNIPYTEKRRIRSQLRLLLTHFLGQYFANGNPTMGNTNTSWLHNLCAQMQDPINLRGGVSSMQTLSHTSPEHLSRTFRKELGCTPTEYVNNLRLTYAANLLSHTDQPIIEIGNEVGLDNLSYFYRIFKARYGTTPAQFRTQNRKRSIP